VEQMGYEKSEVHVATPGAFGAEDGPFDATAPTAGVETAQMSRRQVIGRITMGAVVVGVGAWVIPELLIATPSGAAVLSVPGTVVGLGGTTGTTPPSGDLPSGDPPSGSSSSGEGAVSGVSSLASTAAPSRTGGGADVATGGGGTLAFTGSNLLREVEVGTALIVGGWTLNRWSSRAKPESALHDDVA